MRHSRLNGDLLRKALGVVLATMTLVACGGAEGDSAAGSDAGPRSDGGRTDGGPVGPGYDGGTGEVDQQAVGPEGGTLSLWNGDVTVDVPPGALLEETTITAERFTPPGDLGLVEGATYDFGPDGAEFLRPLTVGFRVDAADLDGPVSELRIAKLVGGELEFQPTLRVAEEDRVVRAQLQSFSTYGPRRSVAGCSPRPPRGLSASVKPGRQGVRVYWAAAPGTGSVEIQRAVVSAGDPCSCAAPRRRGCIEDAANPGQCILNGLQDPAPSDWEPVGSSRQGELEDKRATSAGVYNYRARSGSGRCRSAWSPIARAIVLGPQVRPADPTNVVVQPLACGGAQLGWNAVIEASGYEVQRKLDNTNDPFETVGVTTGTELSYVDTRNDLEPGAEYVYRIVATNAAGKSPGRSTASVTNADAEFMLSLSNREVRLPPGESRSIDISLRRFGFESFDVELDFETLLPAGYDAVSAGVTPTFVPRVADLGSSTLELVAHPDVNPSVVIEGRVVATTTVAQATTCRSVPIRIEVGDATCRVDMPDIVVDPQGQTMVDLFLDRAGFGGALDLSVENADPALPLTELGVFPSFIPNPAQTRSSAVFDVGSLPFPDYEGTVQVRAESTDGSGVACESEVDFTIDGGGSSPMCDQPLTVELKTSVEHCETTFEFEGKKYDAWEVDEDLKEVYLYAETNRPIWKREWTPGLSDAESHTWVESLQAGKEVDFSGSTPRAWGIRVWDLDCDRDESATDFIVLVPGDAVCDG